MAMQSSPPAQHGAPILQDPLSTFPRDVASTVLLKAGPHTRLVSRTYHALHPPLRTLAPHSTTDATLQAALPTLPSTLTSLDLRAMSGFHARLTPATLDAIPAALPHLQQLLLPYIDHELYPAALRTLQACPHLHTLLGHPAYSNADSSSSGQATCWAILQEPHTAARLRALTLPDKMLDTPLATPLPPFARLTHLRLGTFARPLDPDHVLLRLATAAPSLRFLQVECAPWSCGLGWLPPLLTGRVSQLSFACEFDYEEAQPLPMGVLLQQFGSVTTLRSLTLSLSNHFGWTPAEAGWLSRLTLLTSLDVYHTLQAVCYEADDEEGVALRSRMGGVVTEVAASLARLPALQRLRLSVCNQRDYEEFRPLNRRQLTGDQLDGVFQHLAAATQLRHLALEYLPLPSAAARLLTSLQGLTSLHLCPCIVPCGDLGWVSTLTRLEQVCWDSYDCDTHESEVVQVSLWRAVATLPCLHTLELSLCCCGAPAQQTALADLLVALQGRLERLRLAGGVGQVPADEGPSDVLAVLQGMQRLRVLDLWRWRWEGDWEALLGWLPRSLRQCYLPISMLRDGLHVAELQAACPWVVLRAHDRRHQDGW